MSDNSMAVETVEALYLAKIIANQEEIMKMLAEIISKNEKLEVDRVYAEHITAAASVVPSLVNDFLNRVRKAAKGHTPFQ